MSTVVEDRRHCRPKPSASFDVDRIRAEFPILRQKFDGQPLVYLDNAATAQKPQAVINALCHFYEHECSNIHRGVHRLADRATLAYEQARAKVQQFSARVIRTKSFLFAGRPRQSIWWPKATARHIFVRATKSSFRRWSITRTSFPGKCSASKRARSSAWRGRRSRPASRSRSTSDYSAREHDWWRLPTRRTCSAPSRPRGKSST